MRPAIPTPVGACAGQRYSVVGACAIVAFLSFSGCEPLDRAIGRDLKDLEGSVGCSSSRGKTAFPKVGEQQRVAVSFQVRIGADTFPYSDYTTCRYAGSSCETGTWTHFWIEDRTTGGEWQLGPGISLAHDFYAFCDNAFAYREKCQTGQCSVDDWFHFAVRTTGKPGELVRPNAVGPYGATVENYKVTFLDELE